MTGKILTVSVLILTATLISGTPADLQAANLAVPRSYPTIAAAFAVAQAGDRIELAPGIYRENHLSLPNGVTFTGTGNNPAEVIIDGQDQGRILLAEGLDRSTLISGITFKNGRAAGHTSYDRSGGAIFCSNSLLQLANCAFDNNISDGQGGAIRCNNSSPLITGSVFTNNTASAGGGGAIDCSLNSSPLIRGCEFRGNSAAWGAALSCRGLSSPVAVDVLFVANNAVGAKGYGGAVFADYGSTPTFTQSTFLNNTARYGGALACLSESETNLERCTLIGNSAQIKGGGLFSYYAVPHITASIISFHDGSGVSAEGDLAPLITCSDIFGNTHGDWVGSIAAQLTEGENLAADPLFCGGTAGAGESFVLEEGSPCSAANLACGTMGAWPVGCDGAGTAIITFEAEWLDQDAELTWHSQTAGGSIGPDFRLVGFNADAPDLDWEVPIQNLGGGYFAAQDNNSRASGEATYTYQLYIADGNGTWTLVDEVSLASVPDFPGIQALTTWPNPFNPMTTISFRLGTAQHTRISIYSPDGRRILVLADRQMDAGLIHQVWNGRDSQGNTVSSGTYIVLVEGSVERKTQKITLLK